MEAALCGRRRSLPARFLGFVTLALPLLSGCASREAPPRPAFADLEKLRSEHPDWGRLREWDLLLAETCRAAPEAWAVRELPRWSAGLVRDPAPPPEPDLVDAGLRAKRNAEDDIRLAVPILQAQAEDEALADLRRLRATLRQAWDRSHEEDLRTYEEAVRRAGDELAQLQLQMHTLRPNPSSDRLFYTSGQIRSRAGQYDQAQRELTALRAERIRQLETLLAPRENPLPGLSRQDLARIGHRRDERLRQAVADLRRQEKEITFRLGNFPRWPAVAWHALLGFAPEGGAADRIAERMVAAAEAGTRDRERRRQDFLPALAALRRARRVLEQRIAEETETVARNRAFDLHLDLRSDASHSLPDVTDRLRGLLRAYFERSSAS